MQLLRRKKSEEDEESSGIKPNRQNLQRMDMIVDESAVRKRFVDGSGGNNNRDNNGKRIGANSCIDSTDSHVAANSTQHGHNFAAEPAEADDLEIYVDHGVNRISLGVQSMVPHVLASLGREHNPDNVHNSVEIIRNAGIKNLNLCVGLTP